MATQQEAEPKKAEEEPEGEAGLPGISQVGWLSFFTFSWVTPLMVTGRKRQVDLSDLPRMSKGEDTLRNGRRLLKCIERIDERGGWHPLIQGMLRTFWKEFLFWEVLAVANHFMVLLKPLIMKGLLEFQEAQEHGHADDPGVLSAGVTSIVGLILMNLFEMVWSHQFNFIRDRINIRTGSALRGTVLARCIEGQIGHQGRGGQADSGPAVYNVLSFDIAPNQDIIWTILGLWILPITLSSTMGVLLHEVEGAAIPGLLTIIGAKIITGVLLTCDGLYRHKLFQAKDVRLDSCNEGFNHVRTLQMLSWVGSYQSRILEARRVELRYQAIRLWAGKMNAALDYSLGTIVTLVTLAYYTKTTGGELKASLALTVIGIIMSLTGLFGQIPGWIHSYLMWRSAYVRINDFLGLGGGPRRGHAPLQDERPTGNDKVVAATRSASSVESDEEAPTWSIGLGEGVAAELQSCTVSWDDSPAAKGEESKGAFSLSGLDLKVQPRELLVVAGPEAQGKTTFLQALLGELVVEAGSLRSPAYPRGSVASAELLPKTTREARLALQRACKDGASLGRCVVPFAAQEVVLMTGTVRWNVLFGAREDEGLYAATLKACALDMDLLALPHGDRTELAQGGANLSGGQRARVGLARAAYRAALLARERPGEPPLVLLDEPFCSLDRRVGREVCTRLLAPSGGLLASCAVVVAACDPWFLDCLPVKTEGGGPRILVLRGGSAVACGTKRELAGLDLPELRGNGDVGAATVVAAEAQGGGAGDASPNSEAEMANREQEDGEVDKLVDEEGRVSGRVRLSTYLAYLRSVGWNMLFWTCVSLTGISTFQKACDLWIIYWTSEDRSQTKAYWWMRHIMDNPPTTPDDMLKVYALWVACFTLSNIAGHGTEIIGGIGAARRIFNRALMGTLGRPFGWWDANPTGRVLNRFSQDVEVMDAAITNILGIFFGAILFLVSHCIVLAIANPGSLALLPVIVLLYEYYARYYRATIREVQRVVLTSMGTVYQEMVEVILGRVTIRAFGDTERFLCSGLDRLDRFQRSDFTKICIGKWVGLRLGLIGYTLGLYNTLQPLLQYAGLLGGQSAALVGFSINYSQGIVGIIGQIVFNWSDIEMQLVSIERLMDYTPQGGARDQLSAELPPGEQGLKLIDVEVRYREGLQPALSGVTLSFPPRQVVAVVGRTGAGKSSLLLSVLQLVPYSGRIEVGGRDLAELDAADVRRKLVGVVPQRPVIFGGGLAWNLDPEGLHSEAERAEALRAVGLESFTQAAVGSDKKKGKGPEEAALALSAGQRQLLCAARTLLRRPRVALLDEVTASLPAETAESTLAALVGRFRERNSTVLVVTHQERLLATCERVVTIASGRIVSDETKPSGEADDTLSL